jgi:iron complex outermembrane recepter protein
MRFPLRRHLYHRFIFLLLPGILCLVQMSQARSPDSLSDLSLEELMEIEVTLATRRPQKLARSAAAITVVTRDELHRAGVRTLPDALRLVPGVQVAQIDGGKWIVTARGFAGLFANKLLVLIDGRSIYSPLFSGVFWESQDVLMDDLDRIEVIRGPGGTLWGANAVNGIINIVTRHAAESTGSFVEVGGGGERQFVGLRHGVAFDKGHVRAYAKHFDRARSAASTTAPVRDDWRMTRAGFRADMKLNRRDELTVTGNAFGGTTGESLTFVSEPPPAPYGRVYFDAEVAGADIGARAQRRWHAESTTEVRLFYDIYDRSMEVLDGRVHNADFQMQHQGLIGGHRLVTGAAYRRTWDDVAGSYAAWFTPQRRTTHLFSGFVHDEIDLVSDRLRLSMGAKLEHNSFTGFEWQPNIRLWYAPKAQHGAWLAVSRPLRTPSRGDDDLNAFLTQLPADSLFAGAPTTLVLVDNNRRFQTERMVAFDGGYRAGVGPVFADLSVFYNRYANLLTQEPQLPYSVAGETPYLVLPLVTQNKADAQAVGVEAAMDWRVTGIWQMRAVYSYLALDVELDEDSRDTITESYEDGSPRHQLSLRSLADAGVWSLAATGRWVDDLNRLGIDAYLTMDTRVSRRFGNDFELALTGRNLLQNQHREAISATIGAAPTAVEREAFVSLTWRQ